MLEQQALWLKSWAPGLPLPASSLPPAWVVLAAPGGTFLGLARRHVQPLTVWFGGISRPYVEVYETEDEALVFALSRLWPMTGSWVVRDAEGERVGTLRGPQARDYQGEPFAVLEPTDEGGRWRAPQGPELGTLTRAEGGWLVRFHECLNDRPLHKMVLLAMLLREE